MVEKILQSMELEDLCGQLLCYEISPKDDPQIIDKLFQKIRPGGIFVANMTAEQIKLFTDIANKYTKVPVIVAGDVESGPGSAIVGESLLPHHMSCGACDDVELVEQAAEETARITRKNGIHWTLSPVADININPNNPVVNNRAIADSPAQVAKIGTAMIRGMQKNGYLMCSCKHFPGDGVDDRNQHFCTSINSLSFEDWMNSFGYVYKAMIQEKTASIMAAHIALPAYDGEYDEIKGYKPSVLSRKLMTDLLKGELGFDGCVVSDAMSMIGACAMTELDRLAVEFINAGGDMVLFPEDGDFDLIRQSVINGKISRERILDAVSRILKMKQRARLFEDQELVKAEIRCGDFQGIADKIGEKSIKIVRNTQGLVPLKIKQGGKILLVNIQRSDQKQQSYIRCLDELELELNARGYETKSLVNPRHTAIKEIMDDYDCILVNCKMSSQDYPGGSLRAGWEHFMALWRGYILKHPKMIFTSFGDPYKLYEFPFLHTYINAFSYAESTQRGFVKVLLGEVEATAKSPVALPGFFDREV